MMKAEEDDEKSRSSLWSLVHSCFCDMTMFQASASGETAHYTTTKPTALRICHILPTISSYLLAERETCGIGIQMCFVIEFVKVVLSLAC